VVAVGGDGLKPKLLPQFLVILQQSGLTVEQSAMLLGIAVGMTTADANKQLLREVKRESVKAHKELKKVLGGK